MPSTSPGGATFLKQASTVYPSSVIGPRTRCLVILTIAVVLLAPAAVRGAPWLIGKRNAQFKLTFFSHATDEEFILTRRLVGSSSAEPGEKLPYPFNGESISQAYLLEARYGVWSFLDFRTLFSYYDLQFNDDGGDRRNTGFGDVYAENRVNDELDVNGINRSTAVNITVKGHINSQHVIYHKLDVNGGD